ncbi:MAG: chemotaxis protein CheB [Pseudomonadota bacterium]
MSDTSGPVEQNDFHVIGITASAGGLEATTQLLRHLPRSTKIAYAMAQHMAPGHKSMLAVLLARETDLNVVEVKNDVVPEPGTLYLTPPNSDIVYVDGKICLKAPSERIAVPKPSGDRLFKSLALAFGERSVGIVLSGTGTDGTYGVKSIREVGGITIAQDLRSAKYDGMPRSAVDTGCIDFVLPPEEIGSNLERILERPENLQSLLKLDESEAVLKDLFQILEARVGINFRDYKESTINRRVARRMAANDIDSYEGYVDFCRGAVEEVDALGQDLLISVTKFFRDPSQFERIYPAIERLARERGDGPLRIWVAGCATGEEVYSLVILFAEALGGIQELSKRTLNFFATDVDENALAVARRGVYPISAVQDIPEHYLDQYFVADKTHLRVRREVKQVVLFSKHNLVSDPPFIGVDMVSLRNVLIYFKSVLQERVFSRLEYALHPNGVLFLGTSESTLTSNARFSPFDGNERIFVKRGSTSPGKSRMRLDGIDLSPKSLRMRAAENKPSTQTQDDRQFEALARSVAPNGFVANGALDIVRVFGRIEEVLQLNETMPLALSTRILRGPLSNEAASMVTICLRSSESRVGQWHSFEQAATHEYRLRCFPVITGSFEDGTVICSVEKRERKHHSGANGDMPDEKQSEYFLSLEAQLSGMRETLYETTEELQKAKEDMQAMNEEYQSTNEELQATNEEFETSNEELQSTNEELITVNEEMHANTSELQRVTVELSAVLLHTLYPLLIVDAALLIRRASQAALEYFKLGDELREGGLHVTQCALPNGMPPLADLCIKVMKSGEPETITIESGSAIQKITTAPFFDDEGNTLGLKLTVSEFVTTPFHAMAALLDEMGDVAHWSINLSNQNLRWSNRVFQIHGLPISDTAPNVEDAINFYHPDDRERVTELVDRAINKREPFAFKARLMRADGKIAHVESLCKVILDSEGTPSYLVGGFREIEGVSE